MNPIDSLSGLHEALSTLPPVPAGFVRVFRGQTAHYPTLTPTACRDNGVIGYRLWHLYQSHLVDRFRDSFNTHSFEEFAYWLNVLVQHYGPGTKFLDVTHSLDVAVWFATHKARRAKLQIVMGTGEELEPDNDITVDYNAYAYDKHAGVGYIYVLDVVRHTESSDDYGALFDIASGPEPFCSCARALAQSACLVAVSENTDLMPFVVGGEPLRIASPLLEAPAADWPTERIYPQPNVDEWCAALLNLPFVVRRDRVDGKLRVTHPLSLAVFLPEDRALTDLYAGPFVLMPPLYLAWLLQERRGVASRWMVRRRLKRATRILLEGPVLRSAPEPNSPHWNDELLAKVPTTTIAIGPNGDTSSEKVPLDNVFVEFSVLEADWAAALNAQGQDLLRAAWIQFHSSRIELWVFVANPSTDTHKDVGPFSIFYDLNSRRLRFWSVDGESESLETLPNVAHVIRACLMLIRSLAVEPAVSAYPSMTVDNEHLIIPILDGACRLVRANDATGYFTAESDSKTPYLGVHGLGSARAFIRLEAPDGFGSVTASRIADELQKQLQV